MSKKRGLGRGLDALLSETSLIENAPVGTASATASITELEVDQLQRSKYQPRMQFTKETLQELAASIKAHGIVQPIVVRPQAGKKDRYEIVAGERRWRAAQMAGLSHIPVVIRELPERAAMCVALIENMQREDLNLLEEAEGIQRLLNEFSLTHAEVAEILGCSRSMVSNLLRLLDLTEAVKNLLLEGKLEMGHARALLPLKDSQQGSTAREVVRRALTVRATEALVKSLLAGRKTTVNGAKKIAQKTDPNVRRLQDDLAGYLGAPVSINHNTKGRGTVRIQYHSLDELEGILEKVLQKE